MLGYGDLLLDGAFGQLDEPVLDALPRMRRSSKDLLELVREMLDLNRLETGRMPVHLEEVVPADVLEEVAAYSADLEVAPDVALRTSCEPELPPITTDRAKVVTILRNLIGNAVKFTREGVIEASISAADDDGIYLTVRDTGAGIAPVLLPHIFEPFRQGEASSGGLRSGVGLGLYIVRRMVDALGGNLSVDSTPGRGSTFRVTIPNGRRPLLDERDRLRAILSTTGGEAVVVDAEGTIVAVNDRWLRGATERGAATTDRLGVGANYFAVCARSFGSEAAVAAEASRGLRDVIDGRREHFTLDYVLAAPGGPEPHRMHVSALAGAERHALVSHVVIARDESAAES
jgi:anti-sigma regulatory factor (Ser/Thr protein kinase)